jgi:hypothetical protein
MLITWNFLIENWLNIIVWYFVVGFVAEVFFWTRYLFLSARSLKEVRSSLLPRINKKEELEARVEITLSENELYALRKAPGFGLGKRRTNLARQSEVSDALNWIENNPPNFSLSRATGQTTLWPLFMVSEGFGLIEDSVAAVWKKAKSAIRFVSKKLWEQIVK